MLLKIQQSQDDEILLDNSFSICLRASSSSSYVGGFPIIILDYSEGSIIFTLKS